MSTKVPQGTAEPHVHVPPKKRFTNSTSTPGDFGHIKDHPEKHATDVDLGPGLERGSVYPAHKKHRPA